MHPVERKQNLQRLQRELKALQKEPVPGVHAVVEFIQHQSMTRPDYDSWLLQPLPANMLEWHYVIEGPSGSPFQGGFYHGIIRFPQEYPFKPPSIRMLTPSGRFEPNQRICLSMSDFHPESWNCMWSVSSILQGLVSFMLDHSPAIGTITSTDAIKRQLARKSMRTNCQDQVFRELFHELVAQWEAQHPNGLEEDGPAPAATEQAAASAPQATLTSAIGQILLLLLVCTLILVSLFFFVPGEL